MAEGKKPKIVLNEKQREYINEKAKKYGFTYQAVKKWYCKAITETKTDERYALLGEFIKEAIERRKKKRMSKGCKSVSIYNDGILMALFKWKQEYDWEKADSQFSRKYRVSVGDELLVFDYGLKNSEKEKAGFRGLKFGRYFFVMSAIYSLITAGKPDKDGLFRISLKNVYEFIHRNGRWDKVSVDERRTLYRLVLNMSYVLRDLHGEYSCKGVKAPLDDNFFLFCNGYTEAEDKGDSKEKAEEMYASNGFKDAVLYCKYPKFLEICNMRKQITTIPDDMLKLETEHALDGIKYYIAWWIRAAESNRSISPTIRYDTLERLFGGDHRKMVKRYAKFLEEKGFIKNLRLDHDAVRWDKVKKTSNN